MEMGGLSMKKPGAGGKCKCYRKTRRGDNPFGALFFIQKKGVYGCLENT